jgi:hypothetical protein
MRIVIVVAAALLLALAALLARPLSAGPTRNPSPSLAR